jgi:hypothetical protein
VNDMIYDAILGVTPSPTSCEILVQRGLMRFTGNQHNERWEWSKYAVMALTEREAEKLYSGLRGEAAMTIIRTIPATHRYSGLTEAITPCGRAIVVCSTGTRAVEALRAFLEGRK